MNKLKLIILTALLGLTVALPASAQRRDPEVRRVLKKFKHEPSVRDVQRAAIKFYNVSPGKIESLLSKARNKAWLPGLSVGFANSLSSYNLAVDDIIFRNSGIAKFEDQSADFLGFTASATWNLDKLIFNAEELDVLSLVGIQDAIQREVTTLYYVRRRLQIQNLLNPPKTLEARISAELRLEELTGLLDAYTGGYFSKKLK